MGTMSSDLVINTIVVRRASLTYQEAVQAWLIRLKGEKQHVIAAMFGTNGGRIAEVLTEAVHQGAKADALKLLK